MVIYCAARVCKNFLDEAQHQGWPMPRRFVNVAVARDPNEVLTKVRMWVRLLRCGDVIPVVYFSKEVCKEYYVFLGYETFTDTTIPDAVRDVCEKAGFTVHHLQPLAFEELNRFLDPQEFDTTGSDRIPYRARWLGDASDVLDLADAIAGPSAACDPQLDERHERLLAWLTATGEGQWETFVKACSRIGVADNADTAKVVFRRLSLLGHIEASDNAREWVVSPPVFVRTAADPEVAFWCGQRTYPWRDALRGLLKTDGESQPASQAVPRFAIREGDAVKVYESLKSLENPFEWQEEPLSHVLAAHLPDLEQWEESLPVVKGLTNPELAERWEDGRYVENTTFHIRDGKYFGPSGLYRVTRGQGRHRVQVTFYLDQQRQLARRGDWYGLRFLAIRRSPKPKCAALWDAMPDWGGTLTLRAHQRWAALYERALVLASGFLPEQTTSGLLRYRGITLTLAQSLTSKLGVELELNHA
jgi:hypothetical protein